MAYFLYQLARFRVWQDVLHLAVRVLSLDCIKLAKGPPTNATTTAAEKTRAALDMARIP